MQNEIKSLDLTILMPCLNEEATVGICIDEAKTFIRQHRIQSEILIADNGSRDRSVAIAKGCGARVIRVKTKGYGCALRAGIRAARGKVIIMGDCDTTYGFSDIEEMYRLLAENKCDIVIGNRIDGNIQPGAMPITHKLGVRALSEIGRLRYDVPIRDFHCGLRGITKQAAEKMQFHTTGMEFATEMIAEAKRQGLQMRECPVVLHRCKYDRESKLNTISDGFRHLAYMMMGGRT